MVVGGGGYRSDSYQALKRLGSSSPLAGYAELASSADEPRDEPNPMLELAERKLRAGEVLLEQQCPAEALGFLYESMLAAAATRAGEMQIPASSEAPLWLHGTLVPKGVLTIEEAALLSRAMSLTMAATPPPQLLGEILEDARRLVETVRPMARGL